MALPKPAPSPGPHPAHPPGAERPVGTARAPDFERPVGTARPPAVTRPVATARAPGSQRSAGVEATTVAMPRIPAGHALRFQPMVHVDDMPAAVAFFERLGAEVVHGSGADDWVLLQLGTTQLGLLTHPPRAEDGECTVELNFAATAPLDDLERRLRDAGVAIAGFETHPDFGDQLQVRSPDGLLIKINQLEPDIEN
jgi:catechol 2,3-dioxygenase-like lactoylglutathione lyase family enzyme